MCLALNRLSSAELGESTVRHYEATHGRMPPAKRRQAIALGSNIFFSFLVPQERRAEVFQGVLGLESNSPQAQEERRLARQSAGRRATILTGARGATGFNGIGGSTMLLGQTRR